MLSACERLRGWRAWLKPGSGQSAPSRLSVDELSRLDITCGKLFLPAPARTGDSSFGRSLTSLGKPFLFLPKADMRSLFPTRNPVLDP